ncbi:MarR family transcriptional regulator [bacterium C-53]|nr:MarR family transcriptional regulator [Lachnospiraceae bacterium]NBI02438.1 MarR family transcriptional regulator [Lachnospiraceae bacterium]RKJ11540.1 MarR family transcriptional regulator [bacterium C-53]
MNKEISRGLLEFNGIMKESDDIYRSTAKKCGLSDCAFWIFYFLRTEQEVFTQSDICNALYQPKQTVNSALKKMEQDGMIELSEMEDRRSKQIHLTEKGSVLVRRTIDRVIDIEMESLSGMTSEEQKIFIELFHKYTDLLKNNMRKLL